MGKNNDDITELQKKHQKQMREKREAMRRRKARTHRLIVRGAISEKLITGSENMTNVEFQDALVEAIYGNRDKSYPQDSNGSSPRESPSGDTCGATLGRAHYHAVKRDV